MSAFTVLDAAARWRVSAELAEQILEGFRAAGLVTCVDSNWQVTASGLRLSAALSLCAPAVVDHSKPARRRAA